MTTATENGVLLRHITKQLQALGCKDGDCVYLRAFLPEKGEDSGRKDEFIVSNVPVKTLERWQGENRGVYFVVNSGGHNDASIVQCRAIFYEHDDLPKEESRELWKKLGLPEPTLQVDTGGKSIHTYWTFDKPIDPETWKALQTDLLEFADADRKLKNPSRVMRLAGCIHAKTGEYSRIIAGHGKPYSYADLRKAIPVSKESATPATGLTWQQFSQSFRFPISDSVPLEVCLSRPNRELLARGESSGSRSNSAFKLASDLLAASAFLVSEGQRFEGDPYYLFLSFCEKCPPGDGWNQQEWDGIWKSAQSKPRGTTLPPDFIEGCVKGWAWQNCPNKIVDGNSIVKSMPYGRTATIKEPPEDATDEEKLRLVIANYNEVCDTGNRFQIIPLRNKIARDFGLSKFEVDELAREMSRGNSGRLCSASDVLMKTFSEIELQSVERSPTGIASGFYDLDAMTQGFQRSDLIIFAGRPSMGKTACVMAAARHIALVQKKPVAVFSLEMPKDQLAYRMLSEHTGIEAGRLKSGNIDDSEWVKVLDGITALSEMPLWIDDSGNMSEAEIRAKVRQLASEQGELGLIVIDYLQLMAGGDGENRAHEIAKITRALKGLARELNAPIILLSQLSRNVESRANKRPIMADLRESGSIEQDADLIVMLYRDEYYNTDSVERGIAELLIVKHRNGPTGTVKLLFEDRFARFRNLRS